MNRTELDKVRACAKDGSFWSKWYTEKGQGRLPPPCL